MNSHSLTSHHTFWIKFCPNNHRFYSRVLETLFDNSSISYIQMEFFLLFYCSVPLLKALPEPFLNFPLPISAIEWVTLFPDSMLLLLLLFLTFCLVLQGYMCKSGFHVSMVAASIGPIPTRSLGPDHPSLKISFLASSQFFCSLEDRSSSLSFICTPVSTVYLRGPYTLRHAVLEGSTTPK